MVEFREVYLRNLRHCGRAYKRLMMDRYSRYILGFVFAFGFLSQDVWAEDVDYYKLGKQAYRHGEYAQARQYYQQALDNAKAMGDRAERNRVIYP